MLKIVSFLLLLCLHFSHGNDPQPEQIHLSSTGEEIKCVNRKKMMEDASFKCIVHACASIDSTADSIIFPSNFEQSLMTL